MQYETYWSVLDLPTNYIKPHFVCLLIAIMSITIWFAIKKFKKQDANYEKSILLWCVGFTFLLTFSMFIYTFFFTVDTTEKRINDILSSSKVGKVEGVIRNFNRTIVHKKNATITYEGFEVDSVKFSYSDSFLGKFNTFSETNNNVIRNGIMVRMTYRKTDNEIQKIEIVKEN